MVVTTAVVGAAAAVGFVAGALALALDWLQLATVLLDRDVLLRRTRPQWAAHRLGQDRYAEKSPRGRAKAALVWWAPELLMHELPVHHVVLLKLVLVSMLPILLSLGGGGAAAAVASPRLRQWAHSAFFLDCAVSVLYVFERLYRGYEIHFVARRALAKAALPSHPFDRADGLGVPLHSPVRMAMGADIGKLSSSQVRVTKDVCYATPAECAAAGEEAKHLHLDVYRSRDYAHGTKRPVMVFLHGGGWTEGLGCKDGKKSKRVKRHLINLSPQFMAVSGWVAVSIDYRVLPKTRWPHFLIDCKRCVRPSRTARFF